MKILAIILIVWASSPLKAQNARISRLDDTNELKADALEKQNQALQRMLKRRQKSDQLIRKTQRKPIKPYIWESKEKISTGKVYRGILLNSIVSTNLASPVLVRAHPDQGLPVGTKFACRGVSQNKRIQTQCDTMITAESEFRISAQVLNTDGSAGLVGEVEDGKEDMLLGALASNFSQGMLSAAQDRVNSPYGSRLDSNFRNQTMQGLIQTGGSASDLFLDEMQRVTPVVTVPAGEEVLIYFKEAVDEY